jgi:hypothetical protein
VSGPGPMYGIAEWLISRPKALALIYWFGRSRLWEKKPCERRDQKNILHTGLRAWSCFVEVWVPNYVPPGLERKRKASEPESRSIRPVTFC